jgi:hypothetical protein
VDHLPPSALQRGQGKGDGGIVPLLKVYNGICLWQDLSRAIIFLMKSKRFAIPKDEIVYEVRRYHHNNTDLFNYDLDAIYLDLKAKERKSKRKLVSFYPKKPFRQLLQRMLRKNTEVKNVQ